VLSVEWSELHVLRGDGGLVLLLRRAFALSSAMSQSATRNFGAVCRTSKAFAVLLNAIECMGKGEVFQLSVFVGVDEHGRLTGKLVES
jgi:hypothetical protein